MNEVELARLRWQCRRGCKELDILLTAYLDRHYARVSEAEQVYFQYLLGLEDDELLRNWVSLSEKLQPKEQ